MLPRGEAILLLGRPKEGKTLLAVDLAFAVANGFEFLGRKVEKGKVLIISADESVQSLQNKLNKRGFLPEDSDQVFIAPKWDMSQMHLLEEKLESFKPDCVIIDSLKRICLGSSISENSAEFADNIYRLKELCSKHDAALVLIHHTNKDKELKGLDKVRGSSAIAGAVWATWILTSLQPNNPECSQRTFSLTARDAQGQVFELDLDLEDHHWVRIDSDREDTQTLKLKERILGILELNRHCEGLSTPEIKKLLGLPKEDRSIYTCLDRMVDAREIQRKPSSSDRRKKIYCLPFIEPPQPPEGTPPTTPNTPTELNIVESLTQSEFEVTQQITQQNSENTQQPSENTQQNLENILLSNPKIDLIRLSAITQQILQDLGECLPKENSTTDTEQQTIPMEISVQFQVGDLVRTGDGQEGIVDLNYGDGRVVVQIENRFVLFAATELTVLEPVQELQKGQRVKIQTTNPRTIEFNGCEATVICALKKQGKIYVAIDNSDRTPCFWAYELIRLV